MADGEPPGMDTHLAKLIGARLLAARKKIDMTQTTAAVRLSELAPWMSAHSSTISRIENGKHQHVNAYVVAVLCHTYGTTFNKIAPELAAAAKNMRAVIDLTCAPWELNPEPADSHVHAAQGSLFGDWDSGGSSVPPGVVIDLTREPPVRVLPQASGF